MDFKLNIIDSKIYHLKFNDSKQLCKSMVRIEEFYESPQFANQVFELADYIKWYQKENGSWTYYSDWSGFNIPGNKVKEFKERFTKLRGCEKEILKHLPDHGNFYLIATSGENDAEIVHHETAHAYFYLDNNYKKAMSELVSQHISKCDDLGTWILSHYNESVLFDELQAYLSTADMTWFTKRNINLDPELLQIFSKTHNELISQTKDVA